MRKEGYRCSPRTLNRKTETVPQPGKVIQWEALESRVFMDATPVSSALAVPAYAGIPVTDRRRASSLAGCSTRTSCGVTPTRS